MIADLSKYQKSHPTAVIEEEISNRTEHGLVY